MQHSGIIRGDMLRFSVPEGTDKMLVCGLLGGSAPRPTLCYDDDKGLCHQFVSLKLVLSPSFPQ